MTQRRRRPVGGRHRAGYDATLTAALFFALTHTVGEIDRSTSPAPTPASRGEGGTVASAASGGLGGAPSAARLLFLAGALPADADVQGGDRLS